MLARALAPSRVERGRHSALPYWRGGEGEVVQTVPGTVLGARARRIEEAVFTRIDMTSLI